MIVLKPSHIHGVGCFTTVAIRKDELADVWDGHDCKFVPYDAADDKLLHETYCVTTKNGFLCPLDFRRMSAAWYLNHSDEPNLASDDDGYSYHALCDIAPGEELTIDYKELDPDVDNRPVESRRPAASSGRKRARAVHDAAVGG